MNKSRRVIASLVLIVMVGMMLSGCRVWNGITSANVMDDISTEAYMADEDPLDADEGYVLARQTGILETDWHAFTVKLNSVVITLPCTAMYLEGVGLEIDTSFMPADTLVNRGNRESVYYKNEFGDAILVTFMNPDLTPRAMDECLITGIAVTEYDLNGGHLTVTFPGGVELNEGKETALKTYGDDYEVYESDSVHMYTWHDKNSYFKSCEIDYDAKTQRVTSMFINF